MLVWVYIYIYIYLFITINKYIIFLVEPVKTMRATELILQHGLSFRALWRQGCRVLNHVSTLDADRGYGNVRRHRHIPNAPTECRVAQAASRWDRSEHFRKT